MNDIVIATSTSYSSEQKLRIGLSKKTVKNAIYCGYEIIIVDSSPVKKLKKEYQNIGAKVYSQKKPGLGQGRREAIKIASSMSRNIVVWLEPEKEGLISKISILIKPLVKNLADMVIPARTSLKSYPLFQQYSEKTGNLFIKDLTGIDLDLYFGPRVFKKEMAKYFTGYDGRFGDKWDSIFIPVLNAIKDKKRIMGVKINYTHPKKQTDEENHNPIFYKKRLEQLYSLSAAISTFFNRQSSDPE